MQDRPPQIHRKYEIYQLSTSIYLSSCNYSFLLILSWSYVSLVLPSSHQISNEGLLLQIHQICWICLFGTSISYGKLCSFRIPHDASYVLLSAAVVTQLSAIFQGIRVFQELDSHQTSNRGLPLRNHRRCRIYLFDTSIFPSKLSSIRIPVFSSSFQHVSIDLTWSGSTPIY